MVSLSLFHGRGMGIADDSRMIPHSIRVLALVNLTPGPSPCGRGESGFPSACQEWGQGVRSVARRCQQPERTWYEALAGEV